MYSSETIAKAMEDYRLWLEAQAAPYRDINYTLSEQEQITLRHRLAIGGTAVSSIIGSNPYQSALTIYQFMAEHAPPIETNYKMRRGLAMERLIAERACELLKMDLYYPAPSDIPNRYYPADNVNRVLYEPHPLDVKGRRQCVGEFFIDIGFSFLSAQFDCFASYPDDDEFTIIECKTTARNTTKKDGSRVWGTPLEINENGVILNDDGAHNVIPAYYVDQVQWQLLVLKTILEKRNSPDRLNFNTDYAYVAVDIGGSSDIALYKIEADEARQIELLESASYFMLNNVMAKQPPLDFSSIEPPSAGSELEVFQASSSFIEGVNNLNEIKQSIRELKAQEDELKKELEGSLDKIETGNIIDSQGKLLARKTKISQSRLDTKALAKEEPDIYQQYKKVTEFSRVDYY